MNNDTRNNVRLAVIVLLLALIAWYKPGLKQYQYQYLSSLNPEQVQTIVIERQGIESVRLTKQGQHWLMQSPYPLPANPLRVKTVLALAAKRSYSSFDVPDSELKKYALDKPKLSVWLGNHRFDLGSEAPLNGQRYAMNIQDNIHSDKNTVHLINGAVYYQLRAPVDSFISPSLLPPDADLEQIQWTGYSLTLKNGQWQLKTSRENAGIQPDSVVQLINNWKAIQASRVETRLKVTPGTLDGTQMTEKTITIHFKLNNREQTISYHIIQEDSQIKLLRQDLSVAWWITPQQLKRLTEFIPVTKTTKSSQY